MSTTRRYRYRIYPNGEQQHALSRLFGSCRWVFNAFIAERERLFEAGLSKAISFDDTAAMVTTLAKQARDTSWLTEVSAVPLQQAVREAQRAYRNFFDSKSGKRKGKKVGKPKFRSRRDNRQSATFAKNSRFKFDVNHENNSWATLTLPGVGDLRVRMSRELPSSPSSVTVIREPDGQVFASFVVEVAEPKLPEPDLGTRPAAAIDLGLIDLVAAVRSDGSRAKLPAPKHLRRAERQLARAQRELARRQKGGKNREKSRKKVAKIHRKVRETRLDEHHKLALQLVRENQTVVLETLSIDGMVRNHHLAKSISDAAWGTLVRLIEEKAPAYGCTVIRVDRFFPSSKMCSQCGHVADELPLNCRTWICPGCNAHLDRDWNAAVNLLVAAGHAETINAYGEDPALGLALTDLETPDHGEEVGTHRTTPPLRWAA